MQRKDRQLSVWRRRTTAGFSLVELIVVLALIMIMALIGAPYIMDQIRRAQIEGTAQQSMSLLQRTRLQAIRQQSEQTVVATDDGISGPGSVAQVSLSDPNLELWTEPRCFDPDGDGTVDYSDADIIFDSLGKVSEKSAFCVADTRGNIFQVAIDSLQGSPRIRKYLQAGDSPTGSDGFFLDRWTWY